MSADVFAVAADGELRLLPFETSAFDSRNVSEGIERFALWPAELRGTRVCVKVELSLLSMLVGRDLGVESSGIRRSLLQNRGLIERAARRKQALAGQVVLREEDLNYGEFDCRDVQTDLAREQQAFRNLRQEYDVLLAINPIHQWRERRLQAIRVELMERGAKALVHNNMRKEATVPQ